MGLSHQKQRRKARARWLWEALGKVTNLDSLEPPSYDAMSKARTVPALETAYEQWKRDFTTIVDARDMPTDLPSGWSRTVPSRATRADAQQSDAHSPEPLPSPRFAAPSAAGDAGSERRV